MAQRRLRCDGEHGRRVAGSLGEHVDVGRLHSDDGRHVHCFCVARRVHDALRDGPCRRRGYRDVLPRLCRHVGHGPIFHDTDCPGFYLHSFAQHVHHRSNWRLCAQPACAYSDSITSNGSVRLRRDLRHRSLYVQHFQDVRLQFIQAGRHVKQSRLPRHGRANRVDHIHGVRDVLRSGPQQRVQVGRGRRKHKHENSHSRLKYDAAQPCLCAVDFLVYSVCDNVCWHGLRLLLHAWRRTRFLVCP